MSGIAALSEMEAFLFRAAATAHELQQLRETGAVRQPDWEGGSSRGSTFLEQFSYETRLQARKMTPAYELLFCFENSVRELVEARLKETCGVDDWWAVGVPERIRRSAEKRHREEERLRWHGSRGDSLLNYVDFPQLAEIIIARWEDFEDLFGTQDFIRNRFDELNLSRRVLAHTGVLSAHDVERMRLHLQDWLAQVG